MRAAFSHLRFPFTVRGSLAQAQADNSCFASVVDWKIIDHRSEKCSTRQEIKSGGKEAGAGLNEKSRMNYASL